MSALISVQKQALFSHLKKQISLHGENGNFAYLAIGDSVAVVWIPKLLPPRLTMLGLLLNRSNLLD
uniref:Uncharacterized protein n=1 Tax=Octopus bimaculoides TaxID=37653 RepID=A0A0L8FIX4_OCTBM